MRMKPTKNRQRSAQPGPSSEEKRLAARAKRIRAQMQGGLNALAQAKHMTAGAADLARLIFFIVAKKRLSMTKWRDLEETERDAVLGTMAAAVNTAFDCGMTRAEFVEWLRKTADDIEGPPAPVTVHLPRDVPPRANGANR